MFCKIFSIMRTVFILFLIILSAGLVDGQVRDCVNQEDNPVFWIAMPKAYFTVQKYGITLNAYAARNRAYVGKSSKPNVQKLLRRAREDTNFMMVVVSDKWHLIMGDRKNFVQAVQDTHRVRLYFEYVKRIFQHLSPFPRGIINFEPDPMGSFSKIIRSKYNGDPRLVPVPLDKVNMPEVRELNPPNNFAGFWQVVDYLRHKYAPQIMIAPTIKVWGTSGKPGKEPQGGWKADDPQVRPMWEYYARYGVQWDGLAFNFNGKMRPDSVYKSIVRYFCAVADGMSSTYHRPMYKFIWKVKIYDFHYNKAPDQWPVNELQFIFGNIPFLASLGVRGVVIGYGNELNGLYAHKDKLPPALVCWLKEYFMAKDFHCNPQGTIGPVHVCIQ